MLKKRNFFLGGIILFVAILMWGYHLYNESRQSATEQKPAESITAEALNKQYQQDEHAADLKYSGKILEVKGIVSDVVHNGALQIWILSAQNPAGGVSCQMFGADKDSSSRPKPGDTITVKGKCAGFLVDVNLVDCIAE